MEDFFICEPNHMIAHPFKSLFPKYIVLLLSWFRVVSAINLYD